MILHLLENALSKLVLQVIFIFLYLPESSHNS